MSTEAKRDNILHVKMLGNFSMTYNGQSITGKNKTSESQFNYLLEILLHAGSKGVERDYLEQSLFKSKDLDNIHHATQSVIYNAKKRLRDFDLPDVNFIYQKSGVYYWTEEIPVEEDAKTFELLIKEAEGIKDTKKKIRKYLEAIHLYTGEFLENQLSTAWVARENWRYRKLFADTVSKTSELMKEADEYELLEDLGKYATAVQPLSDWETLTMEAYVFLGKYKEAQDLYEKTVDLYLQEQGIRPSLKMIELINKLGEQLEFPHEMLGDIQDRLTEDSYHENGGYLCSYPVFIGIYQTLSRIMERSGQSVFLMLCTIVDSKGNVLGPSKKLDELSDRLGSAIHEAVRRSDVINKYSRGQYLVLLTNTTMENCKVVQRRINKKFMINRQRIYVKYHVNSVFDI